MGKINCIEPLRKTTRVLSKEGLLTETVIDELPVVRILLHVIFCVYTLTLLVCGLVQAVKTNNRIVLNRLICVFLSAITVFAKEFALLRNRKTFMSLMDDLNSDNFNRHSEQQNRHIQFIYRISQLTLRYYILVASAFLLVSCCLPFILDVEMLIPPPFEVKKFEFLYKLGQVVLIVYLEVNSVSCDVLYMSIMGLCIAQLNILEERLTNIFEDSIEINGTKLVDEMSLDAEKLLNECVILHEMLNK